MVLVNSSVTRAYMPNINISDYETEETLEAHIQSHIFNYQNHFPELYLSEFHIDDDNTFHDGIFSYDKKTFSLFSRLLWYNDNHNKSVTDLNEKIKTYTGRFIKELFSKFLKNEITQEKFQSCEKIQFILHVNKTSLKNVRDGLHWTTLVIEVDLDFQKIFKKFVSFTETENPQEAFRQHFTPIKPDSNFKAEEDYPEIACSYLQEHVPRIRHYDSQSPKDDFIITALKKVASPEPNLKIEPVLSDRQNCSTKKGNTCCEHTALNSFMVAAFGHGAFHPSKNKIFSKRLRDFSNTLKDFLEKKKKEREEKPKENTLTQTLLSSEDRQTQETQTAFPLLGWLNDYLIKFKNHEREPRWATPQAQSQEKIAHHAFHKLRKFLSLLKINIDKMESSSRKDKLLTLHSNLESALETLEDYPDSARTASSSSKPPHNEYQIFFDTCIQGIEEFRIDIDKHQNHVVVRVFIKILDVLTVILLGACIAAKYFYSRDTTGSPHFFNCKTRTREICDNILEEANNLELQSQVKPAH